MNSWFYDSAFNILWIIVSSIVFYIITITASRIAGIRSFTTNSSFDFLITLAMGALLASTITNKEISILEGTAALFTLYVLQMLIAVMRQKWNSVNSLVDNTPVLLMEHGKILEENMKYVRITRYELNAKLRAEGITDYSQVRAAVLEATGSVSVMKKPKPDQKFDPALLEGVMNKVKK
ncbi:DUF421 domain-containing protein [Catalinimonas niigatensis]|uniref:DUF421 domain-containing protein n=1 Tax=Catalinimonas niigatensis TaxID=1397264 RepID=UPI0026655D71|nr:YetF domain-containing protein [Catalinimonas niigatensis]WPP50162.1 DUF421 domain-containing protein [Catalinimonas niigatensis]